LIHVADVVLEGFDVVEVASLFFVQLPHLFFHTISLRNQIFYYQVHVIVRTFEVNNLAVHVGNLLSHLGNFFLSGTDVPFQLFDFVV